MADAWSVIRGIEPRGRGRVQRVALKTKSGEGGKSGLSGEGGEGGAGGESGGGLGMCWSP